MSNGRTCTSLDELQMPRIGTAVYYSKLIYASRVGQHRIELRLAPASVQLSSLKVRQDAVTSFLACYAPPEQAACRAHDGTRRGGPR